ncbi:MAG: universal stress protein [Actinomycetota bacterium]|nr:universal stress protein [Actinomycetota bacterium]
MRRVVVGVRNTESSRSALRWAAERAFAHAARLEIVTAVHHPSPISCTVGAVVCVPDRDELVQAIADVQTALIDAELPDRAFRPEISRTIEFGDPYRIIRTASASADLLVLGRGGRRRPGALTRRCLERLACPVVLVADGHLC